MEQIIVLQDEQLETIVYKAVRRCLEENGMDSTAGKPADEGFYTREELCELLHIAYPTLWRMEKRGLLKSTKVGRKNLYDKKLVGLLVRSGKLAKYSHDWRETNIGKNDKGA